MGTGLCVKNLEDELEGTLESFFLRSHSNVLLWPKWLKRNMEEFVTVLLKKQLAYAFS